MVNGNIFQHKQVPLDVQDGDPRAPDLA